MMTPEQLNKLPKWAQEEFMDMSRQHDAVVKALNRFCDQQTESPIRVDEYVCTGETQGPSSKTVFIQGHRVNFTWAGVELEVFLSRPDDGQRPYGIQLQWNGGSLHNTCRHVALVPSSFQSAHLVAKENMR